MSKGDGHNGQRTEIVFILDASGSMVGLEDDTIGGFNSLVEKNRDASGKAVVSTVLFSADARVIHDRRDIREVPRLTRSDYRCCGCTALLDAVGGAIRHVDLVQSVPPEGHRSDRVLFVITTDGHENASWRFTYPRVRHMIEERRRRGLGVPLHRSQHRCRGGGGAPRDRPGACGGLSRGRARDRGHLRRDGRGGRAGAVERGGGGALGFVARGNRRRRSRPASAAVRARFLHVVCIQPATEADMRRRAYHGATEKGEAWAVWERFSTSSGFSRADG